MAKHNPLNPPPPPLVPSRQIAKAVREALERKGMTQTDLSKRVGHASGSEISRYLNGRVAWSRPTLFKVCKVLDLDPEQFLKQG